MSYVVEIKYDDLRKALEPLRGLKLVGRLNGPPTNPFPLRQLVEKLVQNYLEDTSYRGHIVKSFELDEKRVIVCHFSDEEPDDFCICVEGEEAWKRIHEAALTLSKMTKESYTLILQAIIHALQGMIEAEEGQEIIEITDPDDVIKELLTWLPEYLRVAE